MSGQAFASDEQALVAGAPLNNPNVKVHIVEQKPYADHGAIEITAYPAAIQVNGKFTQHFGVAGGFVWHLHENFGLMAMGVWNYSNRTSSFSDELLNKTATSAQSASSLLLVGAALAGVEATPFYGKFALFENHLIHFSIVLNGAAGAGSTRIGIKPENQAGPATYGETGYRFMAEVGGGFRVKLARYVTVRLEVRDILYSANVSAVNGCNLGDLTKLDMASRMGSAPVGLGSGCNATAFAPNDIPLAKQLVANPSSDVLNNLGMYAGMSLDL